MTLASTALRQGSDLCPAHAKLAHTPLVALSRSRVFLALSERCKTSLGSLHARRALPACTARLWASALQLAPAEQDRTQWAVRRHFHAPAASLVLFSLKQDRDRASPAAQACIAQRPVLLLQPECAWPALTPHHTLHRRPALHVGWVPTKIKLVKAHAYHVMRVHTAAAQASLLSAVAALQERFPRVAPPRLLLACPVPPASTA